jgi:hypothetical protein
VDTVAITWSLEGFCLSKVQGVVNCSPACMNTRVPRPVDRKALVVSCAMIITFLPGQSMDASILPPNAKKAYEALKPLAV